ncbi:Glycine cleavage system transcriptional activator [Pelagimonas phthalicica]|uniref:Glycine cleavage system transcriptional activator n=1 Tax=Pelagimonas phthalicica TaxID=1037362 RepID=A0A238JFC5_9RHOB|nr:LysR family transcriptional regulator [Pelagimonas phthalicica]TDS92307.1 LysR family transcriptional regulator [Pelagimonas phthalicica]SMX29368.1 Glycine cleavage system transcriptional activator [Pelagimonas phthalicica]
MKKSLPPLTWFRAFEAAARHLSFTAAGEEIGLTQSAVSQQVKALETRLRVALFTRHARGLSLTDDGRKLLPQVGSALGTLAAATDIFDAGPSTNLLTIAASISVTQWIIAPNLADFTQSHPNVRIRFLSAIWPDDFNSAQADVEIRFGSEKQVGKNAQLLTPNRLVAVKAPKLIGDLQSLPLIEAVGTSSGWKKWAAVNGPVPEPQLFADSYGMALYLASQGNGVALVSEFLVKNAIKAGDVETADSATIPGHEGYYLSIDDSNLHAVQFQEWLLRQLR